MVDLRRRARLLRRQEVELAFDHVQLGAARIDRRQGDAEVDQAHAAVEAHQHVLGADVAVDDAQAAAALVTDIVGEGQREEDLAHDPQRLARL